MRIRGTPVPLSISTPSHDVIAPSPPPRGAFSKHRVQSRLVRPCTLSSGPGSPDPFVPRGYVGETHGSLSVRSARTWCHSPRDVDLQNVTPKNGFAQRRKRGESGFQRVPRSYPLLPAGAVRCASWMDGASTGRTFSARRLPLRGCSKNDSHHELLLEFDRNHGHPLGGPIWWRCRMAPLPHARPDWAGGCREGGEVGGAVACTTCACHQGLRISSIGGLRWNG